MTAALAPKFPRSTKPAPLFCDLSRRTAQHRSFPAPWSVYSHPLQNRVPRVQVLLPLPKSQVSLLRYLTFSLVCGRIWQRGAPAGPPAVRVVGACSPVGCVQARPSRQARQVLLPLPKNRRKFWVSAGFLFACIAWLWCSRWFRQRVFTSGFTRPQPSSSPPAPRTHPTSAVFA